MYKGQRITYEKLAIGIALIMILVLIFLQNPYTWTLGLNIGPGLVVCLLIGLVITVMIYIIKGISIDSNKELIIFLLRFFHYFIVSFHILYVFIFPTSTDTLYLFYLIFLVLHWWIVGECIITYIEKKILNPDYKLGDTPDDHEWLKVWTTERYMPLVINIMTVAFTYNVLIVLRRSHTIPDGWIKVVMILVIWCLVLQSCLSR